MDFRYFLHFVAIMFLKIIGVLARGAFSLSLSYPRVCVKVRDDGGGGGGGDVDLRQLVQFPNDPRVLPCILPPSDSVASLPRSNE